MSTHTINGRTVHHPDAYLAFHWRSKRRVLNVAIALRGKSTGWGDGGPARRWFVGHRRTWMYHRGTDLTLVRSSKPGHHDLKTTLAALSFGSGPRPTEAAR